jgi:tetratricopeptide (TPR) repeat protein
MQQSESLTLHQTLIACILVLLIAAVWAPSLKNGFCWDDRRLIIENPQLADANAVKAAFRQDFWESPEVIGDSDYYRPLVTLSYILDYNLWKLDPRGYHATNLGFHLAICVLLYLLLVKVGLSSMIAALSTLVFGVHPALAENVAWVSGRTDLIAAFFVLAYLYFDQDRERPLRRFFAFVALAGALLAKEIAVIALPIALCWQFIRGVRFKRIIFAHLEDLLVLILYFVIRNEVLGAATAKELISSHMYAATALTAFFHMIGILLLPTHTRVEYAPDLPANLLLPSALAGALLCALLALGVKARLGNFRRRAESSWDESENAKLDAHSTAAPELTLIMLGIAAALSLFPVAAAIITKGVVGPRLIYLTAAFLLPLLTALALTLPLCRMAAATVILAILALALLARQRIPFWINERTLFEHALAAPSPSVRTHVNFAIACQDDGLFSRALKHLNIAAGLAKLKATHYTRGLIFNQIGCADLAIEEYRQALALAPGDIAAAGNLGAVLAEINRPQEAREVMEAALKLYPNGVQSLEYNLAMLPQEGKKTKPAASKNEVLSDCGSLKVAEARVGDPVKLNQQALLWLKMRQYEHAESLIKAALVINPSMLAALLNRAQLLLLTGKHNAAKEQLFAILRDHSGNPQALKMLEYLKNKVKK